MPRLSSLPCGVGKIHSPVENEDSQVTPEVTESKGGNADTLTEESASEEE